MILDRNLLVSESQAITGTASSTHAIDLGAVSSPIRDVGTGELLTVVFLITEDFDLLTSLNLNVVMDSTDTLATPTIIAAHSNVPLAKLVAGARFRVHVPSDLEDLSIATRPPSLGWVQRFLGTRYSVNGTNPTAGKITAGFVLGTDDIKTFPGGFAV